MGRSAMKTAGLRYLFSFRLTYYNMAHSHSELLLVCKNMT